MMSALGQLGGRLYRGEVSFDFVGRKRLWYAISGLILVISIVAVLVRGLSFSVDFKGGAIFTFPSSSTTLSQVQNAVESGGVSGAIVQQTHGQQNGWQIQTKSLTGAQTVTLEKTLFGVRDANLIAMFDRGRKTVFDMRGHAVVHTAPNVRKMPVTNECPSGYEAVCVGTTTSQRMERFTRPLMERDVRILGQALALERRTRDTASVALIFSSA